MGEAAKGADLAQETFGNRLAEARRRRGLTLEQVHLQLRISPAILESLEAGDFFHMPLKGHARNMVSSYARFLGLDPKVLTEQFLSEYHDFENRESRRASAANNPLGPAAGHYEVVASTAQRPKSPAESQGVRSMWNKPIPT
jgi:cytoskeletal protein RodZ